ncbi:hypothetical protein WN944_009781 [Citrus x changshan-huyou]|uniref:Uncharacterized protein n=1 Tax=Citrus x changshan-huyou TaxID=2935761 RepID=A0AAP0MQE9_9ROSI
MNDAFSRLVLQPSEPGGQWARLKVGPVVPTHKNGWGYASLQGPLAITPCMHYYNNFILVLWQDYIDQENRIESINSVLNKSNRTMGKVGNQKAPENDSKCEERDLGKMIDIGRRIRVAIAKE